MRFPAKKKRWLPKSTTRFPAKKRWHSPTAPLRRVALGIPSPSPTVCKGGCTLTSQPKFLASIGYQIFFAMVVPWRATRAGLAMKQLYKSIQLPRLKCHLNISFAEPACRDE